MSSTTSIMPAAGLVAALGSNDIRIVDCRFNLLQPDAGRSQYESGHIPGAIYADLDRDLSAPVTARSGRHPLPPAETFAATLGRLGIDNDTTVMAYDQQSGAVAARLWWMLHSLGHHRVCVLDGGIAAWIAQGQPLQSGAETVAARRFEARQADYRKLVTTDEVLAALVSGRLPPLVDAREAARFAGEEEPIDAVAGHIPGAVNLPFGGNLDDAGHWKSPAMLAERLAARIPDATSNGWVSMCGSGVTACHLALAADRANFAAPRLYAGSWSEWIRDPARPVSARQQP